MRAPIVESHLRQKRHCGARTRRGTPCQCKALKTKRGAWRCRLHGGLSTGPRTAEGASRSARFYANAGQLGVRLDRHAHPHCLAVRNNDRGRRHVTADRPQRRPADRRGQ
jgi:hypothetical protein